MTTTIKATDQLRRFWTGWLKPFQAILLWATALMVVVAGLSAFYPWMFGKIIDALTQLGSAGAGGTANAQSLRFAIFGPVALLIAAVVKAGALYGSVVLTNRAALSSTTALQQDLFTKLIGLDYARLSEQGSGTFAARFLNDIVAVREAVLRVTNSLFKDLLTLIGVIGVMIYADWQLALVTLVVLPLAIGPVAAIGARLRKAAGEAQAQASALSGVIEESLGGARLVKTYGLEASESARVGKALQVRMGLLLHMAEQKGRVDPILEVLGGIAVAGVFGFAGYRIAQGASSVGDLFAFIASLLTAAQAIRSLGGLNAVLQEGLAALSRFFIVLDEAPAIAERTGAQILPKGAGEITFEHVRVRWPNGQFALDDVSFVAHKGQTLALVGPSGAGKSTILNLVPRLYDPESGHVRIDGIDTRDVTLASLRARIALVSQDATLFDASVAENVAMGLAGVSRADIARALEAAACDFVARLSGGMDARVGPRGAFLSGGERQRLSLARAIVRDADILLLDEPTSALDSESEARVQDALDRFAATRTTIVVAHRLSTVRRADLILVFDQGRMVEQGNHDTLIDKSGLYSDLAARQFGALSVFQSIGIN